MEQTSPPSISELLQMSPRQLSSGVSIAEWARFKSENYDMKFDLAQIDPTPKDAVTKYLNWVCLNAKVFNNFGILLNSAQINNFIDGKSTEIYIILKRIDDKMNQQSTSIPTEPVHIGALDSSMSSDTNTKSSKHSLHTPSTQFPSLSLAISPTVSHDRAQSYHQDVNTESRDIMYNMNPIQEQSTSDDILARNRNDNHLDSNDDTQTLMTPAVVKPNAKPNSNANANANSPENLLRHMGDHIVYDGIQLYGRKVDAFLQEKEKLQVKLKDAMCSYQNNNSSYLENIVAQYRQQKLQQCQTITNKSQQKEFLAKLQHDLQVLDTSLKQQFEESKNTLYSQLSAIHYNRLRDFAIKLNNKIEAPSMQLVMTDNSCTNIPSETCKNTIDMNNDSNKSDLKKDEDKDEEQDEEQDEDLNITLKQVSTMLERSWKIQLNRQQKHRNDKKQEMNTLKEILSVYQNLTKLIQVQSVTLRANISDLENLYSVRQPVSTHASSPDKVKTQHNPTQIQLLSSSDHAAHKAYQDTTPPLRTAIRSATRKRRKANSKQSSSGSGHGQKPSTFSFEHRQTTFKTKKSGTNAARRKVRRISSQKN